MTYRWGKTALWFPVVLAACGVEGDPVDQYLRSIDFSGAALVADAGVVVLREGYGAADRELGVANTADGIFRIGSLTKPLTATAMLHAHERGALDLEDPVCMFLRVCPAEWGTVEIRHLLDHTSGIPDLFGALDDAPLLETTAEIDRVLRERTSIPLRAVPGAEYAYSNFNYMLAGYVLEVATGVDWESYLTTNVLEPVGAVNTRYDDVWTLVEGRVHGYGRRDGRVFPIAYDDHSAYAAGGLYSTVDDLRRWHEALVAGQIINATSLDRMFTPNAGEYGLGWQVIEALGRPMHNHTGGIGGFTSHLAWYPDERLLVILLSNVEDENVKALACDVARIVFSEPEQPSPTVGWLGRPTAERCRQRSLRNP